MENPCCSCRADQSARWQAKLANTPRSAAEAACDKVYAIGAPGGGGVGRAPAAAPAPASPAPAPADVAGPGKARTKTEKNR